MFSVKQGLMLNRRWQMSKRIPLLLLVLLVGLVGWPVAAQDAPRLMLEPLATLSVRPDQHIMSNQFQVAWSPDGTLMAVVSDGNVQLWETETGSQVAAFELDEIEALAFNADGSLLAVAGRGGNVLVAYVDVLREIKAITSDTIEDAVFNQGLLRNFILMYQNREESTFGIFDIAFSPDSSVLLVSDGSDVPRLWDIREAVDFSQFDSSGDPPVVRELSFSVPEGMSFEPHRFMTGAQGFYGLSYERGDSETLYRFETLQVDLAGGTVSLLPDPPELSIDTQEGNLVWANARAAVIQNPEAIRIVSWDRGEDNTLAIPAPDSDMAPIRAIGVNNAATLIVTSHFDRTLRIWDTSGVEVFLHDLDGSILRNGFFFSPDDSKLAVIAIKEMLLFSLAGELAAPSENMAAVLEADSGCDIDLSGVVALLVRTQATATNDADDAATMLAEAGTQLQALEAECGG
jgi:WD40 repeat protein